MSHKLPSPPVMYLRISLSSLALANLGAMAGLVMMLRCGGTDLKGEVAGLISWPVTQIPHRLKGNVPYHAVQGNGRKEKKKCATGVSPVCPGPSCYQPPPTVEHSHLHSWHCVPSRVCFCWLGNAVASGFRYPSPSLPP